MAADADRTTRTARLASLPRPGADGAAAGPRCHPARGRGRRAGQEIRTGGHHRPRPADRAPSYADHKGRDTSRTGRRAGPGRSGRHQPGRDQRRAYRRDQARGGIGPAGIGPDADRQRVSPDGGYLGLRLLAYSGPGLGLGRIGLGTRGQLTHRQGPGSGLAGRRRRRGIRACRRGWVPGRTAASGRGRGVRPDVKQGWARMRQVRHRSGRRCSPRCRWRHAAGPPGLASAGMTPAGTTSAGLASPGLMRAGRPGPGSPGPGRPGPGRPGLGKSAGRGMRDGAGRGEAGRGVGGQEPGHRPRRTSPPPHDWRRARPAARRWWGG